MSIQEQRPAEGSGHVEVGAVVLRPATSGGGS
ncbi:hypothetical protein BCE75_10354 [Isoptericola sp. CG 20/1183]|uniref:Uncharacterized protein n=1 Tax=Isoptericola halotolerans TaxID=300560 RepID=A0ABX5EJB6_9MICO|nr:hypothetical protein BCL65_10355 [Isoptericola halotolerans]PRZ08927.1 hypothetical protein BCE75_10354 [Isoptericola sp. CG 20/1183]